MTEKKEKRRYPETFERINYHVIFLMMTVGSFLGYITGFEASPLYSKVGVSIIVLGFTFAFVCLDFTDMCSRRLQYEDLLNGADYWLNQEENNNE